MITWYRVWARVKQAHKTHFTGLETLVDFVYWPILNIVLWGLNAKAQQSTIHPNYIFSLLTCLVLFRCFIQAYFDVCLRFLHELWSKNAINLFVSPLNISEWVVASVITGIYSSFINLLIGTLAAWLILDINLWSQAGILMLGWFVAVLSGGALGMFTMAIILHLGARAEKLVWLLAFAFSPVMGIYYPLSTLPIWAQCIGYTMPVTHTFRVIWTYMTMGYFDIPYYLLSVVLGMVVWLCAWWTVHWSYRIALTHGLTKLEDV